MAIRSHFGAMIISLYRLYAFGYSLTKCAISSRQVKIGRPRWVIPIRTEIIKFCESIGFEPS
jgi:hypothetical protein